MSRVIIKSLKVLKFSLENTIDHCLQTCRNHQAIKQLIETITGVSRRNRLTDLPFKVSTHIRTRWVGTKATPCFNASSKYHFFERNRFFPRQIITSKSKTIKHESLDSYLSSSKRFVLKKDCLNLRFGVSPFLKNTNSRAKCLFLSKRIQDPSNTRTQTNINLKT